jgi:hypothetical protein
MLTLLRFSLPLIFVGSVVGLVYNDAAVVISAQVLFIVFHAIGYGIAALIRCRRDGRAA